MSKTKLKGDRTVDSYCMFRKGIEPKVRERRQDEISRTGEGRKEGREREKEGPGGREMSEERDEKREKRRSRPLWKECCAVARLACNLAPKT